MSANRILRLPLYLFVVSLLSSTAAIAYTNKLIMLAGQDASGIPGAKFSSSFPPDGVGLSASGKALFKATLQEGVGGITADNNEGIWVFEADSLRLIAQKGGAVPQITQVVFSTSELPTVYMGPDGQIGMEARYSPDGTFQNETHAFFVEENGEMRQKFSIPAPLPSGDTLFSFQSVAFNAGRLLFSGAIVGPTVSGSSDAVIGEYSATGFDILAQSGKPLPGVPGGWVYFRKESDPVITPSGKTIYEVQARRTTDNKGIGVVYSWDPVNGHVPLRVSGLDSTFVVFGNYQLNTQGNNANISWETFGLTHGLFNTTDELIVAEGDVVETAPNSVFLNIGSFGLFDNDSVIFQAGISDGRNGVWGGDATGITKIALQGDPVPGSGGSHIFWRMNNMDINRKGQVAFSDLAADTLTFNDYVGVWITRTGGGFEEILRSDDTIVTEAGDTLIVSDAFVVNDFIPRTGADGFPTGLNDNGEILLSVNFTDFSFGLIIASPGGLKVNSNGDAPDADLTDGICSTGDTLADGSIECTLRAALMEANAQPGRDKITFDIVVDTPIIQPLSELPHITEEAVLDGATQTVGIVEVDGSLAAGGAVDGLVIDAGPTVIRALNFSEWSANGVVINHASGADTIQGCAFGRAIQPDSGSGNGKHGVLIVTSSNNVIGGFETLKTGDTVLTEGNLFHFNDSAGVLITEIAGVSANNTIRGNSFNLNGTLGIDIPLRGVTLNDTMVNGAFDEYANFPVFDSVLIDTVNTKVNVFGTIEDQKNASVLIDLYLSDNCDTTFHGEGQEWKDSVAVTTDNLGAASFQITLNEAINFDSSFLTMLATVDGETSEFSKCWPSKTLELVDGRDSLIKNQNFELFKVTYSRPNFTDSLIDTVTTDDKGKVDIQKLIEDEKLALGDSVKLHWILHTDTAVKHRGTLATAHTVHMDNLQFDSAGRIRYDSLGESPNQKVKMNHTTLSYNLLVSVEWDASVAFLNSIESGMRNMANYMWDVSDGQVVFDTIRIYDDRQHWDSADVRIHASNQQWPLVNVGVGTISRSIGRIMLPRVWFGSEPRTRNKTFTDHPITFDAPRSFRTFAHEFGHYALWLSDEYKVFSPANPRCASLAGTRYGYMDFQYVSGGEPATELSSDSTYADVACRNNVHWSRNNKSCWGVVEEKFQKVYDSVFAEILRPGERDLQAGLNYLPGPNNSAMLDLDVGADVVFPVIHSAPTARDVKAIFTDDLDPGGNLLPNIEVELSNPATPLESNFEQGKTSDSGGIWILGYRDIYVIESTGFEHLDTAAALARGRSTGRVWLYGAGQLGGGGLSRYNNRYSSQADSIMIAMKTVSGNKQSISTLTLGAASDTYILTSQSPFTSAPAYSYRPDGGAGEQGTLAQNGELYSTTLADTVAPSGSFKITAQDDSSATFFFGVNFVSQSASPAPNVNVKGPGGSGEFDFANSAGDITRAATLSTLYPVIRTGLDARAVQAGAAHSLAVYPDGSPLVDGSVTIRYADIDIAAGGSAFASEQSLAVFHWNELTGQWELTGGSVDTFYNEVTADISQTGVYAAFTTESISSCCDTPGDATNDGSVNIADITFVVAWLFNGGPDPVCFAEADATADSKLNIQDVTFMIAWLFNGGPDPVCGG